MSSRLIFADFSLVVYTMQPFVTAEKLITRYHLSHQLWITDFPTNRSQGVLVSDILSPLLFILHTDDCCHLVKFADNKVLLSPLSEQHHRSTLQDLVECFGSCCFELDVDKTKEMTVSFSPKQRESAEALTTITAIRGKAGGNCGGVQEFFYYVNFVNVLWFFQQHRGDFFFRSAFRGRSLTTFAPRNVWLLSSDLQPVGSR